MRKRWLGVFAVVLLSLASAGCAGTLMKNYGSFEPDRGITQAFEGYQINPDLNYYFSGPDPFPNAIMGLQRSYTLSESLWKKVDMTPERFKDLVWGMHQRADETGMSLWGFSMRDEGGHAIGVWYSVLFAPRFVKVGENKVVDVGLPDQHVYRDPEREDNDSGK